MSSKKKTVKKTTAKPKAKPTKKKASPSKRTVTVKPVATAKIKEHLNKRPLSVRMLADQKKALLERAKAYKSHAATIMREVCFKHLDAEYPVAA